MTHTELIEHLENLEQYTHYSEDAPALREVIEMLKCSEMPNSSEECTQKCTRTHACDCIERQAAIDIERRATVDTNPEHFESHQKFVEFMDDAEISSFGRWQWSNGFNTALIAVGIDLKRLPSAQPEITEEDVREWCYKRCLTIIDNALYLEMRSRWLPSAQPDLSEYSDKLWRNAYERGKREAQSERKWIPCGERLPERGKDVLVTRDYDGREDNNKSCRYVEVASCYGEDDDITWSSFSDEYKMKPRNHHVVAWLPLPEPYGGE